MINSEALMLFATIAIGIIVFLLVLFKTIEPDQVLVKTGIGLKKARVCRSWAFIFPGLHKYQTVNLREIEIRIELCDGESPNCIDGIKIEVIAELIIHISDQESDIIHIVETGGFETEQIQAKFRTIFIDALRNAVRSLAYEQAKQHGNLKEQLRIQFRNADGKGVSGKSEHSGERPEERRLVLDGFVIRHISIEHLEHLPLDKHDEHDAEAAKGIKKLVDITSTNAEEASKRKDSRKEVDAQLEENDLNRRAELDKKKAATAEARIEREQKESLRQIEKEKQEELQIIEKSKSTDQAKSGRDIAQIKLDTDKKIEEIRCNKEIREIEQQKEKDLQVAELQHQIDIANKEKDFLQAQLDKLSYELEKARGDENVITERDIAIANRSKEVNLIKFAQEIDAESYKIETLATANLQAAKTEREAAQEKSQAIREVGAAEVEIRDKRIQAENQIEEKVVWQEAMEQIIPLLPQVVEKLMIPAEKIESIRILNINGLDTLSSNTPGSQGPANNVVNTILNAGMVLPVFKEILSALRSDNDFNGSLESLKRTILSSFGDSHINNKSERSVAQDDYEV